MSAKVLLVAGARPNYMKIAPLWWAMRERGDDRFAPVLVHTGQHYDDSMSAAFFRDLGLPEPHVNLAVGSGSHAAQTARVMIGFEQVLETERPDVVVVVGDVNSTAACALVTSKIDLGANGRPVRPVLAHVEAGLRSRDRDMPEEVNRIVADALSDLLFTTCRDAAENLTREGLPGERIHFVGNPMIDSLRRCLAAANRSGFLERLRLGERGFGLCTLHRPSNVDHPEVLEPLLDALAEIAADVPVLLPLHPRTRERIARFGLGERVASLARRERVTPRRGLVGVEPLSYLEMLQAMRGAAFVLTDSGGIQEETTALGVPCVTLRENTERPITVSEGTNVLAGRGSISEALDAARRKAATGARVPELWDGRAGERIVAALAEVCPVTPARIRYLHRVAQAYLGSGPSQLTFWHEPPEANPRAFDEPLGEYYQSFFTKADYTAYVDADGVPMLDYRGHVGKQYNPIAIAQWGLGNWNRWRRDTKAADRLARWTLAADWLVENLSPNAHGLPVWKHQFDWEYRDTLRAGWYSALAQGQGLSLLCRAHAATGDESYIDAAHAAFGVMTVATDQGGVLIREGDDGAWLEEVVVDPPTHILNGFLWAIWGVRDYAVASRTRAAWALLRACGRTLRRNLPAFDCGFWSLYEQSGTRLPMLASPFYHGLHVNQLTITARLLDQPELMDWSERWRGYASSAWCRKRAVAQKALFKALYY